MGYFAYWSGAFMDRQVERVDDGIYRVEPSRPHRPWRRVNVAGARFYTVDIPHRCNGCHSPDCRCCFAPPERSVRRVDGGICSQCGPGGCAHIYAAMVQHEGGPDA